MIPPARLVNEVGTWSKEPDSEVSNAMLPSARSTTSKQESVSEDVVSPREMMVSSISKLSNIESVEVMASVPLVGKKAVSPSGKATTAAAVPFVGCESLLQVAALANGPALTNELCPCATVHARIADRERIIRIRDPHSKPCMRGSLNLCGFIVRTACRS